MLETLRLEDIAVQLSVVSNGVENNIEIRPSGLHTYYVPLSEFIHLHAEIRNLTCKPPYLLTV
jgi:hypothetical protein